MPARVEELETQDFVKELLRKTWSLESALRPSMQTCGKFLSASLESRNDFKDGDWYNLDGRPPRVSLASLEANIGWRIVHNLQASQSVHVAPLGDVRKLRRDKR